MIHLLTRYSITVNRGSGFAFQLQLLERNAGIVKDDLEDTLDVVDVFAMD
jgi:hypothetical protein